MVRASRSRLNEIDINFDFQLLAEDEFGSPRIDVDGNNTNEIGIYPSAIQDFTLGLRDLTAFTSDRFLLDGGPLEGGFRNVTIGRDVFGANSPRDIPNPISVDLVAQQTETIAGFLQQQTTETTIEYNLVGGGLAAFGINELTLAVRDADNNIDNGFQVVLDESGSILRDSNSEDDFQIFSQSRGESITINLLEDGEILEEEELTVFEIDPIAAVNDIEYITEGDDDLPIGSLGFADLVGISGPSASDPSIIETDINFTTDSNVVSIRDETVLLEAEDLNLDDSAYQVESSGVGDLIGLRDSSIEQGGDVTGEVSIPIGILSDEVNISGDYNLTISTFDENDGAGTIEVLVNGERQGDLITLDENPNARSFRNRLPNENIRREFTIGLSDVAFGDEILIRGTSDEFEFTRIDSLLFEEII